MPERSYPPDANTFKVDALAGEIYNKDEFVFRVDADGTSVSLSSPSTDEHHLLGLVTRTCDNTSGETGDKWVEYQASGFLTVFFDEFVEASPTFVFGAPVYSVNRSQYTLTAGTNVLVGKVFEVGEDRVVISYKSEGLA